MARVFRGRAPTIDADRAVGDRLLEVAAAGEPAVRVWTPHRQVAFGRRDRHREGYDRAREVARERGFPPVERDVGGRAVAYDGETTLAFARATPVADFRRGTDERYERATAAVERALSDLGVPVESGEPDGAFCPGTHSLSVRGSGSQPRAGVETGAGAGTDVGTEPEATAASDPRRKLVGIAQRVRKDAAITAGIVLVDARDELAAALEAVYGALAVPFDPATVGTVAAAGGPDDPAVVRTTLEAALVDDAAPVTVESVDELDGD